MVRPRPLVLSLVCVGGCARVCDRDLYRGSRGRTLARCDWVAVGRGVVAVVAGWFIRCLRQRVGRA